MSWRRPGDKPLSEPMMVSLPTYIRITQPQRVKCMNHRQRNWQKMQIHLYFLEKKTDGKRQIITIRVRVSGPQYHRQIQIRWLLFLLLPGLDLNNYIGAKDLLAFTTGIFSSLRNIAQKTFSVRTLPFSFGTILCFFPEIFNLHGPINRQKLPWWPLLGLLSWRSICKSCRYNSFSDRINVDFIYECLVQYWKSIYRICIW